MSTSLFGTKPCKHCGDGIFVRDLPEHEEICGKPFPVSDDYDDDGVSRGDYGEPSAAIAVQAMQAGMLISVVPMWQRARDKWERFLDCVAEW